MINGFSGKSNKSTAAPTTRFRPKYGIIDRNFPTSELMPLPSTIDLEIPVPAPARKITLYAVAAQESTTNKVPIFCKCKDKRSCCSTRRYACFKAEVKFGVACRKW